MERVDEFEIIYKEFALWYGIDSERGQILLDIKKSKKHYKKLLQGIVLQQMGVDLGTTPLGNMPLIVKKYDIGSINPLSVIGVLRSHVDRDH